MSLIAFDARSVFRSSRTDLAALLILAAAVLLVFSQAIFEGKSISRMTNLCRRDTLFQKFAGPGGVNYDTCVYQEHTPNFLLVADTIRQGSFPLWNPYAGIGCPLLSDTQTTLFSPVTWVTSLCPSLRTYNLTIVFSVFVALCGAYGLARSLGLSLAPSLLCAMCFAFCPYQLFMLEWTRCQNALFPLVFLGFALLRARPSSISFLGAVLASSLLIVSGHIVPSFYCLLFAGIFFLLLSVLDHTQRVKPLPQAGLIAAIGIAAFLLCAPLLLPFAEAMKNSDTFKSEIANLRYVVPWQALAFSIGHPLYGQGSVYIGAAGTLLALFAALLQSKRSPACLTALITCILVFATMARLGPFDYLSSLPVLNWFMTVYCMPILILMLALMAGFGLALLEDSSERMAKWWIAVALTLALFLAAIPEFFKMADLAPHAMRLNDWLVEMAVSKSTWVRESILLIVTGASTVLLLRASPLNRHAVAAMVLVVNAISIGMIARKSMPAEQAFEYPGLEPIAVLQKTGQRMISMGRHVFCPNTNQVYSIPNLVSFSPSHPAGMLRFLRASGITLEGVNQFADGRLTGLVDQASVAYAIASEPVLTADDAPGETSTTVKGQRFTDDLVLLSAGTRYDTANGDVLGKLEWQAEGSSVARYAYCLLVCDKDGGVLWIGDHHPLVPGMTRRDTGSFEIESAISAVVPRRLKNGSPFLIVLQVLDNKKSSILVPRQLDPAFRLESVKGGVIIASYAVSAVRSQAPSRHFTLEYEAPETMIRIYKNTKALPPAYFVSRARYASTTGEAESILLSQSFDPRKEVVISGTAHEDEDGAQIESLRAAAVERPNTNTLIARVKADRPGWLVVTDAYFPGWQATVDGAKVNIERANSVFRAVPLAAGEHEVVMRYRPTSLVLGLVLFCAGVFAILTSALFLYPRSGSKN